MAARRSLSLSARKRRRAIRRNIILAVAFILLISGTLVLSWFPVVRVQRITTAGVEGVEAGRLVAFLEERIRGRFLFVLPRDNIALLFPRTLAASVMAENPAFSSASVSRTSLTDVAVRVTKRTPAALWCPKSEAGAEIVSEECFFLDASGFIFARAPHFAGSPYFRYFGIDGANEPLGRNFLPEETFRDLSFFIEKLTDLALNPTSLSLVDSQDFSIELEVGARLLFARAQNLTDVYANLAAALSSEALAAGLQDVDYLDLRFGNKVYFKEKGAEL